MTFLGVSRHPVHAASPQSVTWPREFQEDALALFGFHKCARQLGAFDYDIFGKSRSKNKKGSTHLRRVLRDIVGHADRGAAEARGS